MRLKICYLANGQSVHTQKWVRYFADKGFNVHLITLTSYLRSRAHTHMKPIMGIKIHELKHFGRFTTNIAYPLMILRIWKAIKEINPDILHAHYVLHYGSFGAFIGLRPFVITVWGSDILIDPYKSIMNQYFVKHALKKADLITTDSISSIKTIVGFGVDERKVNLIIHGVDLRIFHPAEDRKKLEKNLYVPQSHQVVISTRSLESIYDVGTLIKAVPFVLDECPDTYFLIIGDGTLRHQLERLAQRLGVTENVRFVGSISNKDMPKFLGVSDIYVSTSLSDTRSVSLLEAMACELPVVVTDLEGNRECVKEGVNGFLFPKRSFKTLAQKILYLLRDEDIRRKFGVINRRIVEKEGSYEKEMSKMEKLYKDLVEAYKI